MVQCLYNSFQISVLFREGVPTKIMQRNPAPREDVIQAPVAKNLASGIRMLQKILKNWLKGILFPIPFRAKKTTTNPQQLRDSMAQIIATKNTTWGPQMVVQLNEIPVISGKSSLVKFHNLARCLGYIYPHLGGNGFYIYQSLKLTVRPYK